jgi:hypothetical protein
MNMPRRLGFCAVLLAGALGSAADENFRCGKWIVSSNMAISEITAKCGQPTAHEKRSEPVRVRNRNNGRMMDAGETVTEILTWDRGSRADAMVITVVDGRIKSIERRR